MKERKELKEKRIENIQVLLKPIEKEQLLNKVNQTDLTLSTYLRRLIVSNLKEKKE